MKHLLAGSTIASVSLGGAATAQEAVAIATSNPGSLFHNIGTAVAKAAGMRTTIQTATSPNQYIPLVGAGGVEFGVANLQEVNYAQEGAEWFEGQANPELRSVGLGSDGDEIAERLRRVHRDGYAVAHGEVTPGVVGIAAPVFDAARTPIASLCMTLAGNRVSTARIQTLSEEMRSRAARISGALSRERAACGDNHLGDHAKRGADSARPDHLHTEGT